MNNDDNKEEMNLSEENSLNGEIKNLESQIQLLKKENEDLINSKKYLFADMSNMQRRSVKEAEDKVNRANIKTIEAFLSVYDDFERLSQSEDAQKIVGLELVQKSFVRTLQQLGVTEIDTSAGFDTSLHEAIGTAEHSHEKSEHSCSDKNKIVNVVKKGYLYKGAVVLRPAQVIIAC